MLRHFAIVAVLSLGLPAGAYAADLGGYNAGPGSYKDQPAGSPFWTGFYIGGHGGWASANFDFHTAVTSTPDEKSNGGFGGFQMGYNVQTNSNFVLGVEADASFGDLFDRVHDGNFITETTDINAFGTARARLGYAFERFLPYVTGGLGWANVTAGENCPPGAMFGHCRPVAKGGFGPYDVKDTQAFFGWTLGGGVEVAVAQHWSFKAEYIHADLGSQFFTFPAGTAFPRAPNLEMDVVKGGVNYRFGGEYISLK
jgi:outer membrane immunogenic protein